ncbi:MAG: hypothetical protein ABJN18_17130 [Marinobacter sp.]|uniref:hypothetical protein n=1 Tax=Marinobacter sp. TaxID=50741 RepID=UPI003299A346|tara:strand:+ start:3296 stop:3853 length:558 start_codon:yes stop_codon:yes gene_type:complete
MSIRPPFKIDNQTYDLCHLNNKVFTYTREGKDDIPDKTIKFLFSYSDHCFTDHYGDENYIYKEPPSKKERYFCKLRYKLSLGLPDLLKGIIKSNPYVLMTFVEHSEQFFYVEQNYQDETYRVFLEISPLKDKVSGSIEGVRIDVRSAYDEKSHATTVSGSDYLKIWKIIDARMTGVKLNRKKKKR